MHLPYQSCSNSQEGDDSCSDPSISQALRIYKVDITATDLSGRMGQCQCQIVIVPECDEGDDCDILQDRWDNSYPKSVKYKKIDTLAPIVHESSIRYDVASMSFVWTNTKSPPTAVTPPPEPSECTDPIFNMDCTVNFDHIAVQKNGEFKPGHISFSPVMLVVNSELDRNASWMRSVRFRQ